jgi:hypothetical protein
MGAKATWMIRIDRLVLDRYFGNTRRVTAAIEPFMVLEGADPHRLSRRPRHKPHLQQASQ